MAECGQCAESFRQSGPLVLTVTTSRSEVLVYAQNQGRNIIFIKRMRLCFELANSTLTWFIREGGFFDFEVGGERIEPGLSQLKFRRANPGPGTALAIAEYVEVTNRATSNCQEV